MPKKWNIKALHHFIKSGILAGFAGVLLKLLLTGDMLLYIAPHLMLYVDIAVCGLVIMTAFQIYVALLSLKKNVVVCDCGHDHSHSHSHSHSHEPSRSSWLHVGIYSLFIFPLILATILPNTALAGSMAQGKGMNVSGISAKGKDGPVELVSMKGGVDPAVQNMFKTNVYNRDYAKLGMRLYNQEMIEMKDQWFIEKLQAINTFVDNFQGKSIKITGFVYREEGLPASQFIIGRMAMTHCIADISPYGIITETPDAGQYPNDTWLTITGTIDHTEYHGQKVMKINIEQIEPAVANAVPYVYPDWNFASEL
ncbi:TIGR03943 family protein [Paenibacillus sp. HWE-109]|uniref:TIGR03943 family putative permease subunit n=1 Tax=Paenibacillus sp. HWE-109 TaxID=1306526 RepID=UPI001EE01537|nr:TIGR03943 family protein [Paenibacillus sp. HWE-109]UKS25375.1 TIGR03943 family protein [Paenibacillus sp. HWE-109]